MTDAIWDLGRKGKRKENEEEWKKGRKERRKERKRRKKCPWRIRQRGNNFKIGEDRAKKKKKTVYLDITVLIDIGTLFNLYNINPKRCIIPLPRKN